MSSNKSIKNNGKKREWNLYEWQTETGVEYVIGFKNNKTWKKCQTEEKFHSRKRQQIVLSWICHGHKQGSTKQMTHKCFSNTESNKHDSTENKNAT